MQLNSRNDAAYWAKVPGLSGRDTRKLQLYVIQSNLSKILVFLLKCKINNYSPYFERQEGRKNNTNNLKTVFSCMSSFIKHIQHKF